MKGFGLRVYLEGHGTWLEGFLKRVPRGRTIYKGSIKGLGLVYLQGHGT